MSAFKSLVKNICRSSFLENPRCGCIGRFLKRMCTDFICIHFLFSRASNGDDPCFIRTRGILGYLGIMHDSPPGGKDCVMFLKNMLCAGCRWDKN